MNITVATNATVPSESPPNILALTASQHSEIGMGQHYLDRSHPVVAFALRIAEGRDARRILDLATGRGLVAKELADNLPNSFVTAADIDQVALSELRAEAMHYDKPFEVILHDTGSASTPPSWIGAFDVVVAKDLFPFLTPPQWKHFLRQASESLRSGGVLILTAPHIDSRLYLEGLPTTDPYVRQLSENAKAFVQTDLNHFSFSDERHLTQALMDAGLEYRSGFRFGRANGWLCVAAEKVS